MKPEFWDSPDTAKAGPWARLLFIALWNWADDYGRGTANMKELEEIGRASCRERV